MLKFLIGLFIIAHGLVHLWYFTLSQKLVEFKPEMGWSGTSWLFTPLLGNTTTRLLASAFLVLTTTGFALSGVGLLMHTEWWRLLLVASAVLGSLTTLLFWDGSTQLIVQKGLIGLLIDCAILIGLLVFKWPPTTF